MEILWAIIIGAIAGLLAGLLMRGKGYGILWNIVIGVVGGVIGKWIFSILPISASANFWGELLTDFIGAVILLWVISLIKKK